MLNIPNTLILVAAILAAYCLYNGLAFRNSKIVKSNALFSRPYVMQSSSHASRALSMSSEAPADASISAIKEGIKFPTSLNGSDVRVGIIMARWNADIIQGLYKGVNKSLTDCGVKPSNVFTTFVPGSYEIPLTAKFLTASKRVDVIIALGCLIKGETMHLEYIASAVSDGLMKVSLDSYVPCVFGVLTVLNKEQAIARSTGEGNEGLNWGMSAVEMGLARMSAMGMDKRSGPSDSNAFVTFANGTLAGEGAKNSTRPRKFGF